MAIEKRLKDIPPEAFTANGTSDGRVTVADTKPFKVKQQVILKSTADLARLEVKRVESSTVLYVGPIGGKITDRSDISAFTTALSSTIEAPEQPRPNVPEQEIERLTYEEEPTVARRVTLVDPYGDLHDTDNPLPVEATIVPSTIDTPSIFNVNAVTAGIEYFQLLPDDTAMFTLKARNNAKLQLAYIAGTTTTNFLTVTPGTIYIVNGVRLVGKTVFFTSTKDDTIVEISAWT